MEPDDLDFGDLDALVAVLRAGGIEADTNPAALNLPGVWVAAREVVPEFNGLTVRVRLFCVVGNVDPADVGAEFARLFNGCKNTLRADPVMPNVIEAATVEAVMMPGYDQPLPALAIPLDLHTTQE